MYQFLTANQTVTRWPQGQNLDFFCNAFGVNVKDKSGIDGSLVPEYYNRGELKPIREHCRADLKKTDKLFNKIKGVVGL